MGLPLTPRTSLHLESLTSLPRLLSSITLVRSAMDTLLSLIVTQLTLLASLLRSRRRLTVVPVSPWRTTPSSSSLEMPPSSSRKIRCQRHETDCGCWSHQGHHTQGHRRQADQGRREGHEEEVN